MSLNRAGTLPNCKGVTLERAMKPLVPSDAVLCSGGVSSYKNVAAAGGTEHYVVGSKPGTRAASGCYHILQCLQSGPKRFADTLQIFGMLQSARD